MLRKISKGIIVMTISLFIFLVITVLVPYISFILTKNDLPKETKSVKVIAHRGASGSAPENTLASFQKALHMGVDMIELDVHLSKDDSIIVIHDYSLSRTTTGKGNIQDLTYQEIKSFDAGSWFNESFKDEKVPTLNEVLEIVKGQTKILIEFKWPANGIYSNLVEKVIQTVRQHHAESWVVFQSFEIQYLKQINQLAPEIECQQLVFGKSNILPIYYNNNIRFGNFSPEQNMSSVNIFYLYLNKSFIKNMHNKGIKVYGFTLNEEKDIIKALNLEVDGIITNFPEKALKIIGRN